MTAIYLLFDTQRISDEFAFLAFGKSGSRFVDGVSQGKQIHLTASPWTDE